MTIFINISSEHSKYLVFYEAHSSNDDSDDSVKEEPDNKQSKRAKMDYDAFVKKLK